MTDALDRETVERNVLCAAILFPKTRRRIRERFPTFGPDHFFKAEHRLLWSALTSFDSEIADAMGLVEHLKRLGQLEAVGGAANLARIVGNAPDPVHSHWYIKNCLLTDNEKHVLEESRGCGKATKQK